MKSISILLVFFGFVFHSQGQELVSEFKTMYSKLEKLRNFRFEVKYSTNDTTGIDDEGVVSVLVTPKGYFYQTGFCEILINENHTILINDEDRMIIYSDNKKLNKKEEKMTFSNLLQGVDTLVSSADSIYFSFDGLERVYYLRFSNQYFELVELRFSGDMLKHIDYYYNEAMVEVAGMKASNDIKLIENPEYEEAIFTSEFYFTYQNKKNIPTETFSGYGITYNESTEDLLK